MAEIKGTGWIPDLPDRRDLLFSAPRAVVAALPARVDHRVSPHMPDNYDQGPLGSCTANATGLMFQYQNAKQGKENIKPSRLFTYYNARAYQGWQSEDTGAYIRDAIKSFGDYGVCGEKKWPYVIEKFREKPKAACYRKGEKHQAIQYERVSRSLSQMKGCLASGNLFVFGFTVYESFNSIGPDGLMPFPKNDEKSLGGHAITAVGYDDSLGRFTVRNSWGKEWGDDGDFYMPYSIALDDNMTDDFWTIKFVE